MQESNANKSSPKASKFIEVKQKIKSSSFLLIASLLCSKPYRYKQVFEEKLPSRSLPSSSLSLFFSMARKSELHGLWSTEILLCVVLSCADGDGDG